MLQAPKSETIGSGLSEQEVASRLEADGPNELARSSRRTSFRIVFEVLREPMLALLLGGGMLYLLLGSPDEALIRCAQASLRLLPNAAQPAFAS